MDNGLIFPYRRRTVHTELGILTTRSTRFSRTTCGVWLWWDAWDLIQGGKRVNRCDAGR